MLFANIRTDADVERLKRRIILDPALRKELRAVSSGAGYSKSGTARSGMDVGALPSKAELLALYRKRVERGEETANSEAELALRKIRTKSNSGVAVVSVLTKPYPCPGRCTYCPTDVRMPKSYLAEEPAAARALAHGFDPYEQVTARLRALRANGHPTDKVELIVIGGTWSAYHPAYQEEFLIGCFRAANDFATDGDSRQESIADRALCLRELHERNARAQARIVGLSIETRPDRVTETEVKRLRDLGVTKVEIGVQHLDDAVLSGVHRDMTRDAIVRATGLLRGAGLKIVYHMMPNLPGSTPERDVEVFGELFQGEDLQPDMLKIYPCVVVPESELYASWLSGAYHPYDDATLRAVLARAKCAVPPYVRILRVIRDIPATRIAAGSKASNLRQDIARDLAKEGLRCRCIRCREVREETAPGDRFSLVTRKYRASGGTELFLSYEDEDERLASFLRLRLPDDHGEMVGKVMPELRGAAIVRELHTYGRHTPIGERSRGAQHAGFGRRLLAEAERISAERGFGRLAVIAGVGVRPYYAALGYRLEGSYMVRWIDGAIPKDSHP